MKGLRHIVMMALLISGLIVSFAGCSGGGGSNPQPTPTSGPFTRPIDFEVVQGIAGNMRL